MTRRKPRTTLLVALPLLLLWGPSLTSFGAPTLAPMGPGDSELEHGLRDEIERLRNRIEAPAFSNEMAPQESRRVTTLLRGCEEALDGGETLAGVRRLAPARLAVERVRYQVEYRDVKDQDELERRCAEALEEALEVAAESSASPRPASVQALIEVSDGRAGRYITSAAFQGAATRLANGIYYLSLGRSYASLSGFVRSLTCTIPSNPVRSLPGLAGYLDRLDADLVELYQPPISISRHPEFIATSATLKLARQLFEEDAILGSLELALETRTGLGRLHDRGQVDVEWLQESLEDHAGEISTSEVDHSLGALLVGRAENFLGEIDDPDAPESHGEVAVLLAEALPEYFACFTDGSDHELEPAEVTVTLVRWPFT